MLGHLLGGEVLIQLFSIAMNKDNWHIIIY